jgi:sugar phosphate isomerase/epimerase
LTKGPKIGISLYSYGADLFSRRMTVKDAIDHAASLNVQGIEIVSKQHVPNYPYQTVLDLEELRDYINGYGIPVSCYSTHVEEEVRYDRLATHEELIRMVKTHIAEAHLVGAKVVRPYIAQTTKAPSVKEWADKIISVIKEVSPLLKKYGLKWGTEIHSPMPPDAIIYIIRSIQDKDVGLVPDFSAWQTKGLPGETGGGTLANFREAMPLAVHIHAKAHEFDAKGEEPNTPYKDLLKIIKECGYEGHISAEFEGWWMKDFDSKKIAKTHVELLRRYL